MSVIHFKTKAERVAEYLGILGYPIARMDIYGLSREGWYEFCVNVDGSFTMSRGPDGNERVRIWREWKDPEHGKWVERELK